MRQTYPLSFGSTTGLKPISLSLGTVEESSTAEGYPVEPVECLRPIFQPLEGVGYWWYRTRSEKINADVVREGFS